ncbi:oxidoreductase [Nocardia macrotermitis]|uniref:Pyridoxine 4-dehydrogenase n=1 Tax=Nocardia macrotermitis TaxID=2585198 RepID=A0A7K0D9Q8_9NOCA|nr:oxidoreductase [Nocardia macrotermitis]MQY22503.1 Pyridoxine 4-dehydrogenase [Nocardia macrotermitis]
MTEAQTISAHTAGEGRLGSFRVNRMGYGTMKLTGWPQGKQPSRETAIALLRRAVELGVNHFDTSQFYDRDGMNANDLLREALHPYPEDLVLVTKFSGLFPPGLSLAGLRENIEANLRTLGVDRLDVVNLRLGEGHGPAEGSLEQPLTDLAKLQDEGLLTHIGLSNITQAQFDQARGIAPFVCVQNAYNVAMRDADPLLDACEEAGIAFVPFFPVGGFQPLLAEHLDTVAARHGASVQQIALAWLLARSPSILLIPGTTDPAHLEQNIAAGRIELTEEDLALIG